MDQAGPGLGEVRILGQLDAESRGSCGSLDALQRAPAQGGQSSRRRLALLATFTVGGLVACTVLAVLTAKAETGEDIGQEVDVGTSLPRRTGSATAADADQDCHTVGPNETCWGHMRWAMSVGISEHPEWYSSVNENSTLEEFQMELHQRHRSANCPRPCGMSYWCEAAVPEEPSQADSSRLKSCATTTNTQRVKVLTYNLFWWNLFGVRHGNGGSAGELIRNASHEEPFDIMAFQEADDIWWPLSDAGLDSKEHDHVSGHAMALVWRSAVWRNLAHGLSPVAEDRAEQWYGKRYLLWVRLQNSLTKRTVLFANHHGPLPVGTGGICGGTTTGHKILELLRKHSEPEDHVVLVGDFNAGNTSDTVRTLESSIHGIFSGISFGGVDHIFSNCAGDSVLEQTNLGSGGSDHDALTVTFST